MVKKGKTRLRKLGAWLLVFCTVFSSVNIPASSVKAEELDNSTETVEGTLEEDSEQVTEIVEEASSEELPTVEETTASLAEEVVEESTEDITEVSSEEQTEEITKEEETTEEDPTKGDYFVKLNEGGTFKVVFDDGSYQIVEKKDGVWTSTDENEVETDITVDVRDGYYKFLQDYEIGGTVKAEIEPKGGYEISKYSIQIDNGEEVVTKVDTETVSKRLLVEGKESYLSIAFKESGKGESSENEKEGIKEENEDTQSADEMPIGPTSDGSTQLFLISGYGADYNLHIGDKEVNVSYDVKKVPYVNGEKYETKLEYNLNGFGSDSIIDLSKYVSKEAEIKYNIKSKNGYVLSNISASAGLDLFLVDIDPLETEGSFTLTEGAYNYLVVDVKTSELQSQLEAHYDAGYDPVFGGNLVSRIDSLFAKGTLNKKSNSTDFRGIYTSIRALANKRMDQLIEKRKSDKKSNQTNNPTISKLLENFKSNEIPLSLSGDKIWIDEGWGKDSILRCVQVAGCPGDLNSVVDLVGGPLSSADDGFFKTDTEISGLGCCQPGKKNWREWFGGSGGSYAYSIKVPKSDNSFEFKSNYDNQTGTSSCTWTMVGGLKYKGTLIIIPDNNKGNQINIPADKDWGYHRVDEADKSSFGIWGSKLNAQDNYYQAMRIFFDGSVPMNNESEEGFDKVPDYTGAIGIKESTTNASSGYIDEGLIPYSLYNLNTAVGTIGYHYINDEGKISEGKVSGIINNDLSIETPAISFSAPNQTKTVTFNLTETEAPIGYLRGGFASAYTTVGTDANGDSLDPGIVRLAISDYPVFGNTNLYIAKKDKYTNKGVKGVQFKVKYFPSGTDSYKFGGATSDPVSIPAETAAAGAYYHMDGILGTTDVNGELKINNFANNIKDPILDALTGIPGTSLGVGYLGTYAIYEDISTVPDGYEPVPTPTDISVPAGKEDLLEGLIGIIGIQQKGRGFSASTEWIYLNNKMVNSGDINALENGIVSAGVSGKSITIKEQPKTMPISIQKYNGDTQQSTNCVKGTSLKGIKYNLVVNSNDVSSTNGKTYSKGQVAETLTLDEAGKAKTTFEYSAGSFIIKEISGNEWYKATDTNEYGVDIQSNNKNLSLAGTGGTKLNNNVVQLNIKSSYDRVGDIPYRGNVDFKKIRSDWREEELANIPFLLENTTTGEKHIVVTDENGDFTSSGDVVGKLNAYNDILTSMNLNSTLGKTKGNPIKMSSITDIDGGYSNNIWFGVQNDGTSSTRYSYKENGETIQAGSLVPGDYSLTELWCEGNASYEKMYSTTFTISSDETKGTLNQHIKQGDWEEFTQEDLDAIYNRQLPPTISTNAVDINTGIHLAGYDNTVFVDTVTIENLATGHQYYIKSSFMDFDTRDVMTYMKEDKPVKIENTHPFVGTSSISQKESIEFTLNTSDLGGKRGIFQLELWDITEAIHFIKKKNPEYSDIQDDITFEDLKELEVYPELEKLIFTEENIVASEKEWDIESQMIKIPYITTEAYSHETADHQAIPTLVFTDNGNDLEEVEGDSEKTVGSDISVQAEVVDSGEDNSDEGSNEDSDENTEEDSNTKDIKEVNMIVHDKISMFNFLPGYEYQIKSYLYRLNYAEDKGDPNVITEAELDLKATVGVDTPFTYQVEDAVQDSCVVDFNFRDIIDMQEGCQYVIFEEVYYRNQLVAIHSDAKDENQKIYVLGLDSESVNILDGSQQNVVTEEGEKTLLQDKIILNNMRANMEYTVVQEVRYEDTGEIVVIDGEMLTTTKTLSYEGDNIESENGNQVVEYFTYEVDTSSLRGRKITYTEYAVYQENEINLHDRLDDIAEQMYFPDVKTNARDAVTASSLMSIDSTQIIDEVVVTNCKPETLQTVKGILMDKVTGEYLGKDMNLEPIESYVEITPKEDNYTVEVKFDIPNAIIFAGKDVVCFEEVLVDGVISTFHRDINDMDQTVKFPEIQTEALWENGTKLINAEDKEFILNDRVMYHGLIPGKEYTQTGVLMTVNKEGYETPFLANNEPVTSTVTFTPETESGEITLPFVINTKDLAGQIITVFEDTYYNGVRIATHSDINDEGQTVYVPKIRTMAVNDSTGEKQMDLGKKVKLTDIVEHYNLTEGQTYTLKGRVMNKNNKKQVASNEGTFVADDTYLAELTFTIDTVDLQDCDLVVFEEVYDLEGHLVAEHSDWEDEGQTVHVPNEEEWSESHNNNNPYIPRTSDIAFMVMLLCGVIIAILSMQKRVQTVNTISEESVSEYLSDSKGASNGVFDKRIKPILCKIHWKRK